MKKTKIVTTIGPATSTPEKMAELIAAGADVFRFNTKHNTVEWHEEHVKMADTVAKKMGKNLGILLDLQGPELRIETAKKQEILVKKGETIEIFSRFSNDSILAVLPHESVYESLNPGDSFLIDDGFEEFEVVSVNKESFIIKAVNDAYIRHRKGVNLPGKNIDLPSLIDADLEKLDMATRSKIDFIALSFCRSRSDIELLRSEMALRNVNALVIAKIESQQSIDNLAEIIPASDGIMVGRGDLGVEVPIEQLAYWQKHIVMECRKLGKPVIVATQMLQSMIESPKPTRAEACDVANAVWDGTDAIMLSGESASGKYPIKSVEAMTKISTFNEPKASVPALSIKLADSTQSVVDAAIKLIQNQSITTTVIFTQTGYTARLFSRYRTNSRIIAVTDNQKTIEELSLSFSVEGYMASFPSGNFHAPDALLSKMVDDKVLSKGEEILIIHGEHWNRSGTTNSIMVIKV